MTSARGAKPTITKVNLNKINAWMKILCYNFCKVMENEILSDSDRQKIVKAIEAEIPIMITSYTLPHDIEVYINEVTATFLKMINQEQMIEYITYCIQELTTNAKKANTKRIYFKEKGLDIFDEEQYEKGMKIFKEDTLGDINHYMELQKKAGLYVKVVLQKIGSEILVEIRNNSKMTYFEYRRIHDKVSRASQFDSIEDAFDKVLDNSEGAGLGIVIIMLMLRKIGMDDQSFSFCNDGDETVTSFKIDTDLKFQKNISVSSQAILTQLDALPNMPFAIELTQALLKKEPVDYDEVSRVLLKDKKFYDELMTLINYALFSHNEKCATIEQAVNIAGMEAIQKILYSFGAIHSLAERNEVAVSVYEHSKKIAFFAYNLAMNFYPKKTELITDAYVAAILHDVGKIVFFGMNIHENYSTLCEHYTLPATVFEQLSAGINHAEIGAMIAEKWDYEDAIVQAIKYHHKPGFAPKNFMDLTEIVYLANMISCFYKNEVEFYQFNKTILYKYHLDDSDTLKELATQLEEGYEKLVTDSKK